MVIKILTLNLYPLKRERERERKNRDEIVL